MYHIKDVMNELRLSDTEISTPFPLVEEILNKLPAAAWQNPNLTFIDPCCGAGNIIIPIIYKLNDGLRNVIPDNFTRVKHILEKQIYAYDVDYTQILLLKSLLNKILKTANINEFKHNIACADTLDKRYNMKFDYTITNPPYQETKNDGNRADQASNLWAKFWIKCLEITKDTGATALITPTSWLSPSIDLKKGKIRLWDIFNTYDSYANVVDVAKYFPGVGSTFGYVIVNKSGNSGLVFSDNSPISLGFLPKSNIQEVMSKLSKTNNLGTTFKVNQENTPDLRVCVPMTITLEKKHVEVLQSSTQLPSYGPVTTAGAAKDGLYLYVHVNNQQEADKVKEKIIDCLDILKTHCRWSGFLNIQALKMVSYP